MADQNNAPERIWLQDAIGPEYDRTWCAEQINDDDTLYIRADLARADRAAPEGQARAQIANLSVWSGKAHPDQQLVDLSHVLAILDTTLASREALPACQQEAWAADLAAARAEIERLTKERDNLSKLEQSHREQANEQFHRANKAEAERDEARASLRHMEGFDRCTCGPCAIHGSAMLADAERDMRQRAAKVAREAWRDGYDATPHILALPLKHADQGDKK